MTNEGCITVGDSLWKRNESSEDIIIRNGGTIFATNFVQDNGNLTGGSSSANRGYLRVSGLSKTLNTVGISNYLDLTDEGHIGVSPYFDVESPAYSYPTANVTDGGSAPCAKATLSACDDSWPTVSGTCDAFLPITLLEFTAAPVDNIVKLKWTTATEINNDYFTVERSVDAVHFEVVAIVDGSGNSAVKISYEASDEAPLEGISYYRLKQTDYDGTGSFSWIVPVNSRLEKDKDHFNVFPNPGDGKNFKIDLILYSENISDEDAVITVWDQLGRKVYETEAPLYMDRIFYFMRPSSELSAGTYIISLRVDGKVFKKMVVVE